MNTEKLSELLELLGRQVSYYSKIFHDYMGKVMSDDVYDTFATLRDDKIPATKLEILDAFESAIHWRSIDDQPVFDFAYSPKILVAHADFECVCFIWPSQLNERNVLGVHLYKAWALSPYPKGFDNADK